MVARAARTTADALERCIFVDGATVLTHRGLRLNVSFSDARVGSCHLFLGAYAANVPASAFAVVECAGQKGTITTQPLFSFFSLATLSLSRAAQGTGNRYAAAHLAGRQFNGGIMRVGAGVRGDHRAVSAARAAPNKRDQPRSAASPNSARFLAIVSYLSESPSCIAIARSGLRSSSCSW
jgi:hypothetical protein